MASRQAHLTSFVLRHTFKRMLARSTSALDARRVMDRVVLPAPKNVRLTQAVMGGVPGEWADPAAGDPRGTLLYLHGGGYFACSPRSHRPITTAFAQRGFRVFAPEYRLPPEHPFPAAVQDCVAAYRAVRAQAARPIVMAGDSAGGGLTLATMLTLREEGDPLPAAAALFSPFTDLTDRGGSRQTNERSCAMFYARGFLQAASFYIPPGSDPRHPLASPVYADLNGLPPLLIHAGAAETLLDDSTRLAERARECGVPVELTVWPVVPHVWQLFHRWVPEGRQSLDAAAAFLTRNLARPEAAAMVRSSEPVVTMDDGAGTTGNQSIGRFSGPLRTWKLLDQGLQPLLAIKLNCASIINPRHGAPGLARGGMKVREA